MYLEFKTLFECEPFKNDECSKTNCYLVGGPCHQTRKLKYARCNGPTGYAENQKKQTADLYARLNLNSKQTTEAADNKAPQAEK